MIKSSAFEDFIESPWPCFVKPLPDELFTSWITRLARSHLLRYYSFCSSYFFEKIFWNRDLDKNIPIEITNRILNKSILKSERIDEMLLTSYEGSLFQLIGLSKTAWVIPFNLYSNNRKHKTSLSICPVCIKNDGDSPYYRKLWRLSTSLVCEKCCVNLIDSCPNCGEEINFLHAERGKKMQSPLFPISYCWRCAFNLSNAEVSTPTPELLDLQIRINRYIQQGCIPERGIQYSFLYFDVLHKIICMLNSTSPQVILLNNIINEKGKYESHAPLNNILHSFEVLSIRQRIPLLVKSVWLLDKWPVRFRSISALAQLRSKILLADFNDCPYWFYQEVNENNRLVHAKWRKDYPDLTYSSFSELAEWHTSKLKKKNNEKLRGE